jgi:hypothetical protein
MTVDTTGPEDVPDGDAGLSPQPAERLQALMKHIEGTDALDEMAAGLSDWSRLATPARRVGLVHAQLNTLVLALYGASYVQRRRHSSGRGIALGILGGLAATASGYLGGHLTTTRAVTRDNRLLDAPVAGT